MTDQQTSTIDGAPKRPVPITVICVIGFFGAVLTVPLVFSEAARNIGAWYPPMLAVAALIGLVCMVGLWMMRKWAVYVYTAGAALTQVVLVTKGVWNPVTLILPAIVIVIMFLYLNKMR